MAIELQTFNSGDTDYIAKLNANMAALTDAVTSLQAQAGAAAGGGGAISMGMFLNVLFNNQDALIGTNSFKCSIGGTSVVVPPGGVYLDATQTVAESFTQKTVAFAGAVAGTYYIVIDSAGTPARWETREPGSIYSVQWSGTSLSALTKLVPVFFDTLEADGSRISAALNKTYASLDLRLEASEVLAKNAASDADTAMEVAYELQAAIGGVPYRKIGITVDGTTGIKGAIQIDFEGTIVGWSIIGDTAGDISVEVSRKASSKPPAVPAMPNPTTDKISASAPIRLSGAQSASRDDAGVSTWLRNLEPWDVIQFNVTSVNSIRYATLYLRIAEELPSPPSVQSPVVFEDLSEGEA